MKHLMKTGLCVMVVFTSACSVGPNYKRPQIASPALYRAVENDSGQKPLRASSVEGTSTAPEQSFGDEKWWNVFQDPQLQDLIRTDAPVAKL